MESFIKAFDAELDYLFASLRRLGARSEEMEDLAHQVFLGLLRSGRTFDRRRSFQLRLFGLAVRVIARHRRPPRKLADSAESLPLRLAALDRVPLKHRAVLVLHELDHVPLEEIAGSLSMTRIGVAVRLRKARREMEAAVRQLAVDWRADRFGHPDLLLAALGIRNKDFLNTSKLREGRPENPASRHGAGLETATNESPSDSVGEVLQLQDDIFLLEMVMDDFPETIYFKDRQSRFTHINRYAAAHYGIANPALAVGRTDFDFFTDEHASQALQEEQEIIRTGRPLVSVEERETLPDGKLRWVWTTKLPLHDRAGEVVGTFGLSHDIGERKAG